MIFFILVIKYFKFLHPTKLQKDFILHGYLFENTIFLVEKRKNWHKKIALHFAN